MPEVETEERVGQPNGKATDEGGRRKDAGERAPATSEGERTGRPDSGSREGDAADAPAFPDVLRDMAVGAAAGAVVGAAWRVARTMRPELADSVKASVRGAGKEMGIAAGAAVREVLESKPVNQLLPAKMEDGKRAEVMKSTLKEVVAAAGDAARGVLEEKGRAGEGEKEQ